ncbi:MAG: polymerase subunit delta [Abditibacteriota bacterium]|nr:polymerase subunit delta [Abditibacteriota bacterium]
MNEILGHDAKWQALRRAFARGQVPQTLLISGPAHTGKWTLARRYAQLLLCPNVTPNVTPTGAPNVTGADESTLDDALPEPCGTCRACHQIEIESFPDFRVYRPTVSATNKQSAPEELDSSTIAIEQARSFFDEALYRPTNGPRKVMILVQADRMNPQAQNALLKTFEEPVNGVSLFLLTDQPQKLLPTVRSRCWELRLGLVSDARIRNWLQAGFPSAQRTFLDEATRAAAGRPGAAWRELNRLGGAEGEQTSRFRQVMVLVDRIQKSTPVGALGLTESALQMADAWGDEDRTNDLKVDGERSEAEGKKVGRILVRSQIARLLDELSNAYRVRWIESLQAESLHSGGRISEAKTAVVAPEVWGHGLDQIRKTRQYILRNANTNLALDVLFGQLISAQQQAQQKVRRPSSREGEMNRRGLHMI